MWALKDKQKEVLNLLQIDLKTINKDEIFNHTYYQGLLVEIGNLRKDIETYVPSQDKNKLYLNKPLSSYTKLIKVPLFSYTEFVQRAQTADVIWFNERKMPEYFFEVEYTTNFNEALLKFLDLRDFHSKFFIVSDKKRRGEYEKKLKSSAFKELSERIKFLDYESISKLYMYEHKLLKIRRLVNI